VFGVTRFYGTFNNIIGRKFSTNKHYFTKNCITRNFIFRDEPIEEGKEGARHAQVHLLHPELHAVQLHAHRQEGGDAAQDRTAFPILKPGWGFQIPIRS